MIEGTEVIVTQAQQPCWNGEPGRIHAIFTGADGRPIAIVRLRNIALEVCFRVSELRTEDDLLCSDY